MLGLESEYSNCGFPEGFRSGRWRHRLALVQLDFAQLSAAVCSACPVTSSVDSAGR